MRERADIPASKVDEAQERAFGFLEMHRRPDSWVGDLSSSALATAMSCLALHLQPDANLKPLIRSGLAWLAETQHADGGWGVPIAPASTTAIFTGFGCPCWF